jgi:hypothetical protein
MGLSAAPLAPLAVVGVACRLPGPISSPSALQEFLAAKRCALSPVPPGRYPPGALSPAAAALRLGVLPEGAPQALDHRFFRVSPAAVADIDPQQRMALEVGPALMCDLSCIIACLTGLVSSGLSITAPIAPPVPVNWTCRPNAPAPPQKANPRAHRLPASCAHRLSV